MPWWYHQGNWGDEQTPTNLWQEALFQLQWVSLSDLWTEHCSQYNNRNVHVTSPKRHCKVIEWITKNALTGQLGICWIPSEIIFLRICTTEYVIPNTWKEIVSIFIFSIFYCFVSFNKSSHMLLVTLTALKSILFLRKWHSPVSKALTS